MESKSKSKSKENSYRVKEENGKFTIEVYSYYEKPPVKNFWGKVKEESRKVWGWYRADVRGRKLSVKHPIHGCPPPLNFPPCKSFKSLKEAKSTIEEWKIRYHYV